MRVRMSARISRAIATFDSATDWPRHWGHRMVDANCDTRSPSVAGEAPSMVGPCICGATSPTMRKFTELVRTRLAGSEQHHEHDDDRSYYRRRYRRAVVTKGGGHGVRPAGVVGELDRFVLDKGQFGLTQVAVAGGKGDGHDDHTKVDDHAAVGAANQPAPAVAAGREHDLAKRRACGKPGKRERNQRGQAARTNYHCSNKRCGGEPGRPFQASAQQFPAGLAPWAAPERPPSETT
ncbi:hypothetical protein GQR58_028479 [Nymphon striatum]|nr:hypothetical protein GQR58_028479 [Nymphon striatum]